MEIIPVHHTVSLPVTDYGQIRAEAEALRIYASTGAFSGEHSKCYALHHSQVAENPYNFFCISKTAEKMEGMKFPHWCIINPEILAVSVPIRYFEGCMSWPHRKAKKVDRYATVMAKFQCPEKRLGGLLGFHLKQYEIPLYGVMAHIFQHEFDHGKGKTICD